MVWCRNLPFRSGDAELKEIFSRFGKVSMAKVVLDHETEESKGGLQLWKVCNI